MRIFPLSLSCPHHLHLLHARSYRPFQSACAIKLVDNTPRILQYKMFCPVILILNLILLSGTSASPCVLLPYAHNLATCSTVVLPLCTVSISSYSCVRMAYATQNKCLFCCSTFVLPPSPPIPILPFVTFLVASDQSHLQRRASRGRIVGCRCRTPKKKKL